MKMYYVLFVLVFPSLLNAQYSKIERLNCEKFKNGKFELTNEETGLNFIITREDKLQKEETFSIQDRKKVNEDMYFIVEWKNECEYILLLDKTKHRPDDWDEYVDSNGGLMNKIIEVNENCYIVETSFEEMNFQTRLCKID